MTQYKSPFPNTLNIPFLDYQLYARDFIMTRPCAALFLDMGLGKTLITLDALYELNPNGHILVIAPKNIARSTWLDEIKKWKIPIRTKSFVVDENDKELTRKKRLKLYQEALTAPPTVYFINTEKIVDLIENMPRDDLNRPVWCFPHIVIDESQSFKNRASGRFKALKSIRHLIQTVILLSGTPTPEGIEDIWAQIYLLDEGERLGKYITHFRNKYLYPTAIVNNRPVRFEAYDWSEKEIYDKIRDVAISIKNTNLKLPSITYNNIDIHMSKSETDLYKQFMRTQVLELAEDVTVIAKNRAILQAKLSQMASGTIYLPRDMTNPKSQLEYAVIHEHKAEMCQYIIENTDSPVMIAYYYQSDLALIQDYFARQRKNKKTDITPVVFDGTMQMQNDWNSKKIPVLLVHPASAGRGLNLQFGGHTLIWYTIPWSLDLYKQMIKRLHRNGQTEPVVIHHLLTKGTVDHKILDVINAKNNNEERLLNAINITIQDGCN